MEMGTIEREIFVEAPPEIVFDIVSSPEHVRQWWPDDARYEASPGSTGEITFGDTVVALTVVEAKPPRTFTFRWGQPGGSEPVPGNSLLVTFELTPSGAGTVIRMTETGFREMGWATALLEEQYQEHVKGWDQFLPRIAPYAARLT
ncbi:SRPBCC family protein [Actinoplanes sp. NPDC051411]|uniref:SRPBCC family protein n=1 Tax=Actinoplanes sp. NPDC051411 TaxID=3155522 RepID=UPI003428F50D